MKPTNIFSLNLTIISIIVTLIIGLPVYFVSDNTHFPIIIHIVDWKKSFKTKEIYNYGGIIKFEGINGEYSIKNKEFELLIPNKLNNKKVKLFFDADENYKSLYLIDTVIGISKMNPVINIRIGIHGLDSVYGFIKDHETMRIIPNAKIVSNGITTYSNKDGFYILKYVSEKFDKRQIEQDFEITQKGYLYKDKRSLLGNSNHDFFIEKNEK